MANERDFDAAVRRSDAGHSIHRISCVWVKEKITSSTSWLSPIVREIGESFVSGGKVGMKSRE